MTLDAARTVPCDNASLTAHSEVRRLVRAIVRRIDGSLFGGRLSRIRRSYQNRQSQIDIGRLLSSADARIRLIGEALDDAVNGAFTPEELKILGAIEDRRAFLRHCEEPIDVIDYGAGSPTSKRTLGEMERGVRRATSVAKISDSSKPPSWARLLYKLVRKLQPASAVELGSCVGISAAYQAAALELNGRGSLKTLEGSPEVARIATETLAGLGLSRANVVVGPFHLTLNQVLKTSRPIDYFFNDGHHDRDAVLSYFKQAAPYLSEGALVIFDDIDWSDGMKNAWTSIVNDPTVRVSVDLGTMGLVIFGRDASTKQSFDVRGSIDLPDRRE